MPHPTIELYRSGKNSGKMHLVDNRDYRTLCGWQVRSAWAVERKADLTKDLDDTEVCQRCKDFLIR